MSEYLFVLRNIVASEYKNNLASCYNSLADSISVPSMCRCLDILSVLRQIKQLDICRQLPNLSISSTPGNILAIGFFFLFNAFSFRYLSDLLNLSCSSTHIIAPSISSLARVASSYRASLINSTTLVIPFSFLACSFLLILAVLIKPSSSST